jgi:hypothetical protein
VTLALFWGLLLASSTARKVVFWIGAVVLVVGWCCPWPMAGKS